MEGDRKTWLRAAFILDECADVLAKDPPGIYIESRGAKCYIEDIVTELRAAAERLRSRAECPEETMAADDLADLLGPYAGKFVALARRWAVVAAADRFHELDAVEEPYDYGLSRHTVNQILGGTP